MKKSLEIELMRRWPPVFRWPANPMTGGSRSSICSCGDGWYPILDALCETLTEHARDLGREPPEAVGIVQKVAELRVTVRGGDDFDRGAIAAAEALSCRICEETGIPGRLCVRDRYYRTLAPEVAAREGFRLLGSEVTLRSRRPIQPIEGTEQSECEPSGIVLRGVRDLPPGWLDLASILLVQRLTPFRRPRLERARVFDLQARGRKLAVDYGGEYESDRGAAALVTTMSTRIDPITGVTNVPKLD